SQLKSWTSVSSAQSIICGLHRPMNNPRKTEKFINVDRRSAIAMSALPPKADMCGATRDVCYGPIAHICSFNCFISAQEKRLGDGQAERLGGCQIDDEFKLDRLPDRKVSRLRSLENLVDEVSRLTE